MTKGLEPFIETCAMFKQFINIAVVLAVGALLNYIKIFELFKEVVMQFIDSKIQPSTHKQKAVAICYKYTSWKLKYMREGLFTCFAP